MRLPVLAFTLLAARTAHTGIAWNSGSALLAKYRDYWWRSLISPTTGEQQAARLLQDLNSTLATHAKNFDALEPTLDAGPDLNAIPLPALQAAARETLVADSNARLGSRGVNQ